MKLVAHALLTVFVLTATSALAADPQPVDPIVGGSVQCNHRPTLPGCPYWCKFHPKDQLCKKK